MDQLSDQQKLAVVELLFSSEEEDEDFEELVLKALAEKEITREIVPKIKDFIAEVVHMSTDKQFKNDFRVSREVAYDMIHKYEKSTFYPKENHSLATATTAENHVLSFLWYVGNKVCLRDVAQRFGIGKTTLFRQIERVMDYFISQADECIRFPTTHDQLHNMAHDFEQVAGFPNVVGCIDGTSIPIRTPAHKLKTTYCNRHDLPCVTLQAICDSQKRFLGVFAGAPGKIHDARVFKLSDISQRLSGICGKRYHLLGDSAYAIREWLMTPYKDYGHLTEAQQLYNKKFCATRVLIENSFGLLKGRFRQFTELHIDSVDKITKLIIACCVLHNVCINNNDLIAYDNIEEENGEYEPVETDVQLRRAGEDKRNYLKDTLFYNE